MAVTLNPNRPQSSATATSFTIGAAIKNDSVTPSGTPASTKPMNSGIAEHEQNGVTVPRRAASKLPADSLLPDSIRLVLSGVKKDLITPTANTTKTRSINTFGTSKMKKLTLSPKRDSGDKRSSRYVTKSAMLCKYLYRTAQSASPSPIFKCSAGPPCAGRLASSSVSHLHTMSSPFIL